MRITPLHAGLPTQSLDGGHELVNRIRSEFVEMRGFSPTLRQAGRLFHLSEIECDEVLATLVDEGFLHRSADGRYRVQRRG